MCLCFALAHAQWVDGVYASYMHSGTGDPAEPARVSESDLCSVVSRPT